MTVPVRRATTTSGVALLAVLGALAAAGLVGRIAWAVGAACGLGLVLAVQRGATTARRRHLGPADLVTLARSTLACAVAALVTNGLPPDSRVAEDAGAAAPGALVALAATALALDAVDGRVARRTGTASAFGARFDGEADAFLILVLSVQVAGSLDAWVLAIGAARYLFGAGGLVLPWLRAPLPPRHWRKVVAAVQGIVLLVVTTGVLPAGASRAALLVALGLLAESFGRDVLWLWRRHRSVHRVTDGPAVGRAAAP